MPLRKKTDLDVIEKFEFLKSEVYTVFEPIVSLKDGSVFGYEALTRSFLGRSPKEIFGTAGTLAELARIDILCLEKALESRPQKGILFVNVFPATLFCLDAHENDPEFTTQKKKIIEMFSDTETVLELVEEADVDYKDLCKKVLCIKNRYGLRISLDDMANGYDRLALFASLEPDFFKINRPILENCENSRYKKRLIQLFAGFPNSVPIAETVETKGELEVLRDAGIYLVQGRIVDQLKKKGVCEHDENEQGLS